MKTTAKEKVSNLFYNTGFNLVFRVQLISHFKNFQLSVFEWNGIDKDMVFVVWHSITHTFYNPIFEIYVECRICNDPFSYASNGLALLLALLVSRNIRGENIYRTIFFFLLYYQELLWA